MAEKSFGGRDEAAPVRLGRIFIAIAAHPFRNPAVGHRKAFWTYKGGECRRYGNATTGEEELVLKRLELFAASALHEIAARLPDIRSSGANVAQISDQYARELFSIFSAIDYEFPEDPLVPRLDRPWRELTKTRLESHRFLAIHLENWSSTSVRISEIVSGNTAALALPLTSR